MSILRHQADVSGPVPLPTDRVDDASTVTAVSGEALTWYYVTSSAWASATGQAAGTIVTGKLAFSGVLNSMKSAVGTYNDTSLSFAAATRAATKVSIPEDVFSQMVFMTPTEQSATAAKFLTTAGYYAIDHRRGQIWLKSKATVANDSVSYSYMAPVAGSSGPSSNVNVAQFGGTAVTLGQKTSAASIPVVLPSDAAANAGSASSGDNTHMSPVDFTATYASGTTLTLSGLSFTPEIAQFMSVKRQDTSGVSVTYTPDVNAFSYNSSTGVLTVTDAAFTATDKFVVTIIGTPKYTDTSADAKKVVEQSPEWTHYIDDTFVLTNVPNATPDETIIFSMEGYTGWSVHVEKTGGTDTFDTDYFVSNEDALSTADWLEITPTFASGSATADHIAHPASDMLRTKAVKLKFTTAGAANDADFQVFIYRW